ncbi:site-specific DNA-methyltransferase [Emticicia soli]|uniref:site-specific DNA-methyltransferase (adenine-specific) n=1 Tax=Emticicia soli TaxID=2027878 RepID=A0ABW5JB20_9BACT
MDGLSLDIAEDKIQQLKNLFPEVFKEAKIDFKQLRAILGDFVATPTEERYGISWAGKYEAFKEIQKQTYATLSPIDPKDENWNNSENIFIEGENLEVLRILQKSYYGKVKMIYIDPPYNTGNDTFVYPDDFTERQTEYRQRAGITNDSGFLNKQDLIKKNTKENGHFHSAWLSMMYPRLYLAKNLLKEDGVIFISIDDNEQTNLKLLMDEIFGGENFITNIIWEKNFSPKNDSKYLSENHDFILIYCKNKEMWRPSLLPRSDEANARYSNPDNDERGNWTSGDLSVKTYSEYYDYSIITPSGRIVNPPKGSCWRISKEKFSELIKDNRIWFGDKGENTPRLKRFLSEVKDGITPLTIWKRTEVGDNQDAKREIREIFNDVSYFDTPKPTRLIKRILQISTNKDDNHIILDFFAGSCTTAHAVLELNKEDGGNRKFICVQMPEKLEEKSEAYQAGYRNIADIGKARIEKVIENIRNANNITPDFDSSKQDFGFRSFQLQHSNFRQWQTDLKDKGQILNQLEVFTNPILDNATLENMLIELVLKSGFPLTTTIITHQAGEGQFYYLPEYKICIALAGFGNDTRLKIRNLQPLQAIILNNLFYNNDELMANTQLEFKDAGIKLTVI